MKKIFTISLISLASFGFSQVGIQNNNPKATLDIYPINNGIKPDGVLIPRITESYAQTMPLPEKSTLVWITGDDGTNDTRTGQVDAEGFYYFDGNEWVKMGYKEPFKDSTTDELATDNNQNIYRKGYVGLGDFQGASNNITNPLHVKPTSNEDPVRFEGILKSNDSNDKTLVITNTGIVKTSINSSTNFVGFMNSDQTISGQNIKKISVKDELYDLGDEFDTTNSTFIPKEDGVYRVTITITSKSYGYNNTSGYSYPTNNGSENERAVIGLAVEDQSAATGSDGIWVSRLNFNSTKDERANTFITSAALEAGKTYFFAVAGSLNYPYVKILHNPGGTTGYGQGTYFGITRVD